MHGRKLAGRYELIDPVGEGALAQVWRAVAHGDAGFVRSVAIRVVHEDWRPHADRIVEMCGRFAEVGHPALEEWVDVVRDGQEIFLVTDWIEGVSLATWIASHRARGRSTPWPIAVAAVIETLAALDALHTYGRPHEGVTARAVRLDRHGKARLGRAGIVPALREAGVLRAELVDLGIAHPPPLELLAGGAPDASTDVFGAGWVLFEALAAQAPASGPAADVQVALVRGEMPDLSSLRPDVPAAIVAIVERALRPMPRERFDSAYAMARALAQVLRSTNEDTGARIITRSVEEIIALTAPAEAIHEPPRTPSQERPLGLSPDSTMHVDPSELRPVIKQAAGLGPQRTEHLSLDELEEVRVPVKKPKGLAPQKTEMLDASELDSLRIRDDDE